MKFEKNFGSICHWYVWKMMNFFKNSTRVSSKIWIRPQLEHFHVLVWPLTSSLWPKHDFMVARILTTQRNCRCCPYAHVSKDIPLLWIWPHWNRTFTIASYLFVVLWYESIPLNCPVHGLLSDVQHVKRNRPFDKLNHPKVFRRHRVKDPIAEREAIF